MEIVYRKATIADAHTLSSMRVAMVSDANELEQDSARDLYERTIDFFLSGVSDNSYSMHVAMHNDTVVAMGGINYFLLPPTEACLSGKTAYIASMFTLPAYRNRGIASKILSTLMKEAEDLGVERILLKPTKQGKPLYEKHDFAPWLDALVFFP